MLVSIIRQRVNDSQDIFIGNHVWFCQDTKIVKGVKLGNNTIVGANSLVSKSIKEDNVIVAGNPAIIVKNIDWDINRI